MSCISLAESGQWDVEGFAEGERRETGQDARVQQQDTESARGGADAES